MMINKSMIMSLFLALMCMTLTVNAQQQGTKALSSQQQSLITIASFTAQGDLKNLQPALATSLDNGLTINQIKEALVHLYAYAGFPRSIRGLQTFMKVLDERKVKGIKDKQGKTASPINDKRSKYERGVETLYELTGSNWSHPKSGYSAFAPTMDRFLKEHLFADIFERDVLTYTQRELVTVSVLASIGGVEPMLRSHLKISLHEGMSPNQLQQFAETIGKCIDSKKAKIVQSTVNEVIQNYKK